MAHAREPDVERDPEDEPSDVQVHELHRPCEVGDSIGDLALGADHGPEEAAFVATPEVFDTSDLTIFDPVEAVDHLAGRARTHFGSGHTSTMARGSVGGVPSGVAAGSATPGGYRNTPSSGFGSPARTSPGGIPNHCARVA